MNNIQVLRFQEQPAGSNDFQTQPFGVPSRLLVIDNQRKVEVNGPRNGFRLPGINARVSACQGAHVSWLRHF